MKSKGKRLLAWLLIVCMMLGFAPAQMPVQAAQSTTVKAVTLNYSQYVLKRGGAVRLKATVSPGKSKAALKWKTSNSKVAVVSSKGKVTAKGKKGSCTITVTAGRKKATCRITIGMPVTSIKASNVSVTEGETVTLKSVTAPKNASNKKLTYKSSNTKIAKVNGKGVVTGVNAGTARVTITSVSNKNIKKVVRVTVKKSPVKKVSLNYSQYVLKKGGKLTLKAAVVPGKANPTLRWTSSNTKIASVNSKGVVTAKNRLGTASITVTAGKKKAVCRVTVGTPVTSIKASDVTVTECNTVDVKPVISPANPTNGKVTYKSSNTKIATVSAAGVVTGVSAGTAKVTITSVSNRNIKKVVTVTVKKNPVTKVSLNYTQYVLKKSGSVTLKAAITPEGTKQALKWTSSNTQIATVNSKGVVTAKTTLGTANITVRAGKKTAVCKITVGTPVTSINASNLKITQGASASIGASVNPKKVTNDKLTYTSSNTKIAKVDSTGKVTGVKTGTANITIVSVSNGDVTKVIKVTVSAKPPTPQYTISIYNGSKKLKTVTAKQNTLIKDTEAPSVDGKVFLGWYYDKALTKRVKDGDKLTRNISIYGSYGDSIPLSESGSPNYLSATDQNRNFAINVYTGRANVSDADILASLRLSNLTDPSRTTGTGADSGMPDASDKLKVTSMGSGLYSVTADGGYQEGATYQLAIERNAVTDDLVFEGQTTDVIYYNFTIAKKEVLNLTLDKRVKYMAASELSNDDAGRIMAYTGLYRESIDPDTGETVYTPTNNSGSFRYENDDVTYIVGDVIAVYEGVRPDKRNLNTSLDQGVAYIKIVSADEYTYSYKSAEATDVLFTPDIIPVDVDEGDGVTGWTGNGTKFQIDSSKLDFTEGYENSGLDYRTVVEAGDYVAFYTGTYNDSAAQVIGYGRITSMTDGSKTEISYTTVSYDEMMAAMDIYKNSALTQKQMAAVNTASIEEAAMAQVLESGFAEEAGRYLAAMSVETDEVKAMMGETDLQLEDCTITYADGTAVPADELAAIAAADSGNKPDVKVKVSKDLMHFDEGTGFRVEIALKYGFDIQKNGGKQKIAIEMTAVFETEILLSFSANGGAVWKMKWIIPYIYDYKMSGSIDQGLYTGIAITAIAKLDEDDEVFGPEMLEPEGLEDYGQKILDLSDSIKKMMGDSKDDDSSLAATASGGLKEKYARFIQDASEDWIDLVSVPVFSASGSLDPFYVTAYSVNVDFVISANMTVAIGMSFQYEKSERHTFTMMLFHRNECTSQTVDLGPERYQFDFYVMGKLGIRAGIRAKVLFGLFSTKLAGVGLQIEAGAYAKLWGYFYYCLSWEKNKGMESSATGALLIEVGAYLELNLAMEVMNGTISYTPSLYSHEWPIWQVGDQENVLEFAYGDNCKWIESDRNGQKVSRSIPTEFNIVREKAYKIPSEIFRMHYIDLKDGKEGYKTYDSDKKNADSIDEEYFYVQMSEPAFSYDPVKNQILITPQNGKYSYEGTMTITWKKPDTTYSSKTMSKTFKIKWTDPSAGKCLTFETNGGTVIDTQVYGPGAKIPDKDKPKDPTKVGYKFGGWYSDAKCTKSAGIPSEMPAKDLTLYAKWVPIPNVYTVKHYYEKLDTQYELKYTNKITKTKQGALVYTDDELTSRKVIADAARIDKGFEIDRITGSDSVAPDGSSVVEIYYRRQIHSVTYSMGILEDEDNPDVVIRYRYQENIVEPTYFMYGYRFTGFDSKVQKTMGTDNLKYTAQWEPNSDTPYYIERYIQNPKKPDEYMMLGGQNGRLYKEGRTDEKVAVKDFLLDDAGYTLQEIKVNGVVTDENGSAQIDRYGKLIIAYYYQGVSYNINYDTGDGVLTDISNVPTSYVHGVTTSLSDVTAHRTGYNFIGWLEGDQAIKEISFLRNGDISLKAEWRPLKSEIRLFDSADGSRLGSVNASYGRMVPGLSGSKIPTKPGYVFAGYYDSDGNKYYDSEGNGCMLWTRLDGIDLKAEWTQKAVRITLDTNGADTSLATLEGTYHGTYPELPTIEREGYTFAGWTKTGAAGEEYVTASTVIDTYEDHTLTAKWKAATNIPYTVELYVESNDKAAEGQPVYEHKESHTVYGETDAEAVVKDGDYSIPGYTFEADNVSAVLKAKIKADGSTVLKAYYSSNEYHNVVFKYGKDMENTTQRVLKGTNVALPSLKDDEDRHIAKDGQYLWGWSDGTTSYGAGYPYEVEDADVTFTAIWRDQKTEYNILYSNSEKDGTPWTAVMIDGETWKTMGNIYYVEPTVEEVIDASGEKKEKTIFYQFVGWSLERHEIYEEDAAIPSDGIYQAETELTSAQIEELKAASGSSTIRLFTVWQKHTLSDTETTYIVGYAITDEVGQTRSEYYTMYYGNRGTTAKIKDIYIPRQVLRNSPGSFKIPKLNDSDGSSGTGDTTGGNDDGGSGTGDTTGGNDDGGSGTGDTTGDGNDGTGTGNDGGNTGGKNYGDEADVWLEYDRAVHTLTIDFNYGYYNGTLGSVYDGTIIGNEGTGDSEDKKGITGVVKFTIPDGRYINQILNAELSQIVPKKVDHTFVGWDVNVPRTMPIYDIVVTAQYRKDNKRPVTVKYYTQNADDDGYTLESAETVYGEKGKEITLTPGDKTGFVTPKTETVKVLDDGSAVCEFRYDRKEYTLSWSLGEYKPDSEEYTSGKVRYGAKIDAPEIARTGYELSWNGYTGMMPDMDITYYPKWTPKMTQYNVFYRKQQSDGKYRSLYSVRKEALAGSVVEEVSEIKGDDAASVKQGYRTPMKQIAEIAGDGSTVIYFDYDIIMSHVNLDFSGASVEQSELDISGDYAYGSTYRLPALKRMSRPGYNILGWYDINGSEDNLITGTDLITMGDKDITYRLKCEPVTYNITYDLGQDNAANPNNPSVYVTGYDFNIAPAVCEGMAFAGWEWTGKGSLPDGVEIMENGLVHVTDKAAAELSFKAKWDDIVNVFTANLATDMSEQYTYIYPERLKSTITLGDIAAPVREGYIFAGWVKLVPKKKSGYYKVVISDDTKLSALNTNTDMVTAEWMPVTQNEDGRYYIHVDSDAELRLAAECLNSDYKYSGIVLDTDITVAELDTPYFDELRSGWTLDGAEHSLTVKNAKCALVRENNGTIKGIRLQVSVNGKPSETVDGHTYFGAFAETNYGSINGCGLRGITEDEETYRSAVVSGAEYVGGIAGRNRGYITNCSLEDVNVIWNADADSRLTMAYAGGIAGINEYIGTISGCTESRVTVSGCMKSSENSLYIGGVAGINHRMITDCKIIDSLIDGNTANAGNVYAGGFVAADDMSGETSGGDIGTMSALVMGNTRVESNYQAGGIIGDLACGCVDSAELNGVSVYGKNKAGQVAGAARSGKAGNGEIKIWNAKVTSDTNAGVIAGEIDRLASYQAGVTIILVRSMDSETTVRSGSLTQSYNKGIFVFCPLNNGYHKEYTDMNEFLNKW